MAVDLARRLHPGTEPLGSLRIGMVAPPWFGLPPRAYGGIESVVSDLVNQLTLLGHEVTLIGSGENLTSAHRFVQVFETPPTASLGNPLPEVINAAACAAALADIPVGHKVALVALKEGDAVIKYGESIGAASVGIRAGDWVHTHNLKPA